MSIWVALLGLVVATSVAYALAAWLLGRDTRVRHGFEPADGHRDRRAPRAEHVRELALAHKAWSLALLRAQGASATLADAQTVEQQTEVYLRAWLDSCVSLLASGTNTGVAAYCADYVLQCYGQERAEAVLAATRALCAEVSAEKAWRARIGSVLGEHRALGEVAS